MRKILLVLVFALVLVFSAVASSPLGFIMNQTDLNRMGIGWAKVDGTLRKGRISGLYVQNQPIGDIILTLRLKSLLAFAPIYDVQLGGAGGRGSAILTFRQQSIAVEEVRLQQQIRALEGLDASVRVLGGTLSVRNASFHMNSQGCERASGDVSTDIIRRVGSEYGLRFDDLNGPITCRDGRLTVTLMSESEAGDAVRVDAQTSLLGQAQFEMRIKPVDNQLALGLAQYGFEAEDDVFVYRYAL